MDAPELRLERCRPQQIWDALAAFPCVYVPSGPLEWHGLQNAVGLDALKAAAICLRAARQTGGLVFPTIFFGAHEVPMPLGMPVPPAQVQANSAAVLAYLARNGARAVVWLSGHGGTEDYLAIRRAALAAMEQADVLVFAAVDMHLLLDFDPPMDHAAAIETSLMQHLAPETVDLDALDPDPDRWPAGVGGEDPRTHASPARGAHVAETLTARLADAARRLTALDDPIARRKHRQCAAQQVALDELVAHGRAALADADAPAKVANADWEDHLEAFRQGDYDRALRAGRAAVDAARLATAGRLPAGRDTTRIV